MIVAERKPLEDISSMIEGCNRILIVGCGECVTVCSAGGRKEVEVLASSLNMMRMKQGKTIEIKEETLERQCDSEYLEKLRGFIGDYEAVISMACGAGVQFMVERYKGSLILPALNTKFIGVTEQQGIWSERCHACGDCKLHLTGGICPIARCSKSLFNGPCGGSSDGKCEISSEVACGWQLIIERLEELGQLEKYEEIIPVNDWSTNRDGGPRRVIREDLIL